jgi:hypothetical protein
MTAATPSPDDPIRLYAEYIIDAPDEWTPHFTRSELLPMARAYVERADLIGERDRAVSALERIQDVTHKARYPDA